ncbi:hypothetical protein BX616_003202, partial [Lobosporangium transversale]
DANKNHILMVAAEFDHQTVFEAYATNFPRSVELCNKQGWSPLIAAARFGRVNMVELALQLGADLNHRDEEGNTALHHAASYGHLQTITLLIEKGSSATIKNNGGWTAQDFAFSDKVSAHMEECWRSLGRSSPISFSSLYSGNGQEGGFPLEGQSSTGTAPLSNRKEWTSLSNGPLSPIIGAISGATSPRLVPTNAWSEFKRVIVKQ